MKMPIVSYIVYILLKLRAKKVWNASRIVLDNFIQLLLTLRKNKMNEEANHLSMD